MPLTLDSPEAEQLASELADLTGETIADAVVVAIRERLPPRAQSKSLDPGERDSGGRHSHPVNPVHPV